MLPDHIQTLGDPHLGRKFKTGVPLHRVGEREESVWAQFEAELAAPRGVKLHVNMGDLFDKFVVAPEIVIRAANLYLEAADKRRSCTFVVIEGNHDRSKDDSKSSSFDLFALLVAGKKNIVVVQEEPLVIDGFGFVPYQPFKPTEELVASLPDNLEAVFGHWDIQDWGGDNVIPSQLLSEKGICLAVSGHDHLKRQEKRHGVDIIVTGSMQPYNHAEDGEGDFYRTVTLAELDGLDVTNMNVRVLLMEGETLPNDLDCLSLTAKREASETIEVDTSEFESLDLGQMLAAALGDLSVKDEVMSKFEETVE